MCEREAGGGSSAEGGATTGATRIGMQAAECGVAAAMDDHVIVTELCHKNI